jgi:hypothetical protein
MIYMNHLILLGYLNLRGNEGALYVDKRGETRNPYRISEEGPLGETFIWKAEKELGE